MDARPEVTIWTDGRGAAGVGRLLDAVGDRVKPLAVGGAREAGVAKLAGRLDCPRLDDPRRMLNEHPATFLLVASPVGLAAEDFAAAVANRTTVLLLEPIAATFDELRRVERAVSTASGGRPLDERVVHLPLLLHSEAMRLLGRTGEVLFERPIVSTRGWGSGMDQGGASLFALLFDAWHTVLTLTDLPQTISAAAVGEAATGEGVPDDPRRLTGRLGAVAWVAGGGEGGAVLLEVAADAPVERKELSAVGRVKGAVGGAGGGAGGAGAEALSLTLTPAGFELRGEAEVVDAYQVPPTATGDAVGVAAATWRRLLDREEPLADPIPLPHADVLACCLACLLSARTRQPESPRAMLKMHR